MSMSRFRSRHSFHASRLLLAVLPWICAVIAGCASSVTHQADAPSVHLHVAALALTPSGAAPSLHTYARVKAANQPPAPDPNEDIRELIINRSGTVNSNPVDRIGLDARALVGETAIDSTFDDADDAEAVFQRQKRRSAAGSRRDDETEENPLIDRNTLMKEIVSVMEIAYLWGGTDARRGLDCSAFVGTVYSRALGIRLPRVSNSQWLIGSPVKRKDLLIGDLVFFSIDKSRGPVSHVGIYVGEGVFAHAGSRGICVALLDRPAYKRTYVGARRILALHGRPGK